MSASGGDGDATSRAPGLLGKMHAHAQISGDSLDRPAREDSAGTGERKDLAFHRSAVHDAREPVPDVDADGAGTLPGRSHRPAQLNGDASPGTQTPVGVGEGARGAAEPRDGSFQVNVGAFSRGRPRPSHGRDSSPGGTAALAAVRVELAVMLAAVGPVAASLTPPTSLYQDVPARLGDGFIPVALGGRDRVFVRSVYLLEDERVRLRTLIAGQQAAGRALQAKAVA